MILSSDELEILEYLKSWKGTCVPIVEIARCAGGRRKYRESPNWAKNLMARLVDAKFVEVNDRGYYKIAEEQPNQKGGAKSQDEASRQVDGNYFPVDMGEIILAAASGVVGEDYFPAAADADAGFDDWMVTQPEG